MTQFFTTRDVWVPSSNPPKADVRVVEAVPGGGSQVAPQQGMEEGLEAPQNGS